jgi:hypothetical protein
MTSSEEKHMSDSEKNDDHGKWTYHEYENADGERGYIISGGLLPDDDAVNQKAHELGHDINQQDWVRTEKMEGGPVRYFYRGGAIGDELIEDESKEIGPFYDLSEHNYLAHAMFVSGVAIVLGTIILGVTGSEYPLLGFLAGIGAHEMKAIINNDPPLGFLAGIVGFVPIAVGAAAHDTIPGRRVIDSMGAAITDPAGTPGSSSLIIGHAPLAQAMPCEGRRRTRWLVPHKKECGGGLYPRARRHGYVRDAGRCPRLGATTDARFRFGAGIIRPTRRQVGSRGDIGEHCHRRASEHRRANRNTISRRYSGRRAIASGHGPTANANAGEVSTS